MSVPKFVLALVCVIPWLLQLLVTAVQEQLTNKNWRFWTKYNFEENFVWNWLTFK